MREALGDLPERERAAVLLRSLGLGLDDVAASLGVSVRRARKLSDSGHRRLATVLEAANAGERCTAAASTLRALSLGWEIAGRRRARLEQHLATCPGCRATVAALRREGRLAVTPIVLAGASEDGARGLVSPAAQVVARVWDRTATGVEASAGVLGGAVATKVVAGCVAVGIAAGCVAVVAREEPAKPSAAPARPTSAATATKVAVAGVARAPATAQPRAALRQVAAARKAAAARRAVARSRRRVREARQAVRRAQAKTRQAQANVQQAQVRTEQAQVKTEQAQQNVGEAQTKIEQATDNVDQALEKVFGAP